jgi:uncharacterized membrane protein
MEAFQAGLVRTLGGAYGVVSPFTNSAWGWPACETLHFLGLSLLVGTIGMFDLRLLGMAKRVPIGALHRLVPWGILGYGINVITGALFLMTEPREYIYNPAFHFKILFMALAGLNVLAFYLTTFRKVKVLGSGDDAPRLAKVMASASILLWISVLVCGRLLTFYRPDLCGAERAGFLSTCIP